jgi:hypothetical protein
MTIYFSLLVALLGLLLYGMMEGKTAEAGRIAYFSGLLAFLLQFSPHVVTALR